MSFLHASSPARAGLCGALLLFLAACEPGGETLGSNPGPAPGGGLEEGLSTLPTGLWSVRLTGGSAEAVVSNGSANIGLSCNGPTLGIRYRPAAGAEGEELRLTARGRQSASLEVPFEAAGRDMVWTGSAGGPAQPFLQALAAGAALSVTGQPGLDAAFPGTGAGEALASALAPQGCLAG
ncbi:MAG: hypothetical protein AAFQ75_09175 [Pseudomonadota bacterium]